MKLWHTRFKYNNVWYTTIDPASERAAQNRGNAISRGDGKLSNLHIAVDDIDGEDRAIETKEQKR